MSKPRAVAIHIMGYTINIKEALFMRKFHKSCGCDKECLCGYPEAKPAQQLPSKTLPAQHSPMKQNNEYVGNDVYIPVVHPTHTTRVNHTTYKYMHSYPHTISEVNSTSEEHYCVCPPTHNCGCKPNKYW